MANKSPVAQALGVVRSEILATRKRDRTGKKRSSVPANRNPLRQWYKSKGISMKDMR